jgi:hypothetical protein
MQQDFEGIFEREFITIQNIERQLAMAHISII